VATLGAIGSFVGGATGIAAFASLLFTQTNSNNKKRWSFRTLLEIARSCADEVAGFGLRIRCTERQS
jgi:hypothetical protein